MNCSKYNCIFLSSLSALFFSLSVSPALFRSLPVLYSVRTTITVAVRVQRLNDLFFSLTLLPPSPFTRCVFFFLSFLIVVRWTSSDRCTCVCVYRSILLMIELLYTYVNMMVMRLTRFCLLYTMSSTTHTLMDVQGQDHEHSFVLIKSFI